MLANSSGGTGGTREESGLIARGVYYDTPELGHFVSYDDDAEIPDEKPYVDDDPKTTQIIISWVLSQLVTCVTVLFGFHAEIHAPSLCCLGISVSHDDRACFY